MRCVFTAPPVDLVLVLLATVYFAGRRRWRWVVVGLAVLALLVLAG